MLKIKNYKQLIIGLIIGLVFSSNPVFASVQKIVTIIFNNVSVMVNEQEIDADTITYNGVTYLPLRAIAESLDKDVVYDATAKIVCINDKGENNILPSEPPTEEVEKDNEKEEKVNEEVKDIPTTNTDNNTGYDGTCIHFDDDGIFNFNGYAAHKLNGEIFVRSEEFVAKNKVKLRRDGDDVYWIKDNKEIYIGNIYNSPNIRVSFGTPYVKYDIIKSFED